MVVMLAKAGIQKTHQSWIPAFAGLTAYYDIHENRSIKVKDNFNTETVKFLVKSIQTIIEYSCSGVRHFYLTFLLLLGIPALQGV